MVCIDRENTTPTKNEPEAETWEHGTENYARGIYYRGAAFH